MKTLPMVLTAAFLAALAAPASAAFAPARSDSSGSRSYSTQRQVQMLQRSADTANARLQADPRLKQALFAAVRSNDQAEARQLLTRAGFSLEQVSNARLVMVRPDGGGEQKSRIIVTIKLIPPTIIIRF